jgi:hypothetical protein
MSKEMYKIVVEEIKLFIKKENIEGLIKKRTRAMSSNLSSNLVTHKNVTNQRGHLFSNPRLQLDSK